MMVVVGAWEFIALQMSDVAEILAQGHIIQFGSVVPVHRIWEMIGQKFLEEQGDLITLLVVAQIVRKRRQPVMDSVIVGTKTIMYPV